MSTRQSSRMCSALSMAEKNRLLTGMSREKMVSTSSGLRVKRSRNAVTIL